MTPLTPSNEPPFPSAQDDWLVISRFAVAAVGSQGTMGLALAMGLVSKGGSVRVCVCVYVY